MSKKVKNLVSAILLFIGLGGIPDDLERWAQWIAWAQGDQILSAELLGNAGRWLVVVVALVLFLYANDLPQKLWNKFVHQRKPCDRKIEPPEVAIYSDLAGTSTVGPGVSGTMQSHPTYTLPKELAYDPEKDEPLAELHFQGGFDSTRPTLEIQFEDVVGQRYFTWQMETENCKPVNVQRYSILLRNTSDQDLENVTVKVEQIIEEDPQENAPYFGYELPLNPNSRRIRKRDAAWVPVISYRKTDASGWISVEGADRDKLSTEGKLFRPHKRRELHLMVRADKDVDLPARFQCWVDDQGRLVMKRLNVDIPGSSSRAT